MRPARRTSICLVAAGALVAGLVTYTASDTARTPAVADASAGERPTPNPLGYVEWMYNQRAEADGTIPYEAVSAAMDESARMDDAALARSDGQAANRWKLTGPSNIGGRITELAADPTKEGVVYAAAATGGVWKSTNSGQSFDSVWPNKSVQSMGAVAVDENGVVWAGTGEPDNGGGSAYYGDGVYKSTDGGKTWKHMGLDNSGSVGRIAIDPSDPDRVFIAAQGRLHDTNGQRGLFLTEDGGESWELVLEGEEDDRKESIGAIDVAVNPERPSIVLATLWDKIRAQDGRIYGMGSKLYRSADGGKTWTDEQQAPLPISYDDPSQPVTTTYVGRMGIDFSVEDPDVAYLISTTAGGNFNGFFKSTDTGRNWTAVGPTSGGPLQQITGGFAWWFGRVWVDPKDTDHIFVAGVQLAESTNGGETWALGYSVHADQHAMDWDPFVRNKVYLGNDGGFYRSTANGAVGSSWFKTPKLPITQFYAMDSSEQDVERLNAGSQDNNSLKSWQGDGSVTGDWVPYVGGDGMMNRIDPEDQRYYYGCSQNGGCQAFTPNGNRSIVIPGARKNWVAPLEFKGTDTKTLYGASESMYRIDIGAGGAWEKISPDLTGGPTPRSAGYGTITAIGSGYKDEDLAFAGTDDGRLWRSTNASAPAAQVKWKRIKDDAVPKRWVTRVEVSPKKDKWTVASFSGWRWLDDKSEALVSLSKDKGKTWTDISGNLPKAPVNDVMWHPSKKKWLYAGTDVGVFASRDLGKTWEKVGANLPMTPIHDVNIQAKTGTLFAATFGRSIWQTKIKG
jgi:photosystem II stability/assembly factor-like uncharacterized protein